MPKKTTQKKNQSTKKKLSPVTSKTVNRKIKSSNPKKITKSSNKPLIQSKSNRKKTSSKKSSHKLSNRKTVALNNFSQTFTEDLPLKPHTLQINHITKTYNKKKVVNDVSFEVGQGEVVGLLGPNGAGKTTSFYTAVGLIRPNLGKVIFDQVDITKYPMHKRASMGIGYLPQEPSVFRKLTVHDNVMCILESRQYPKDKRKERTYEILDQLKVSHVAKQLGYTLSGGERRRVEIARSLACEPKIILLDEPFAGVDPIAVKDIQEVIKHIQSMNIGILVTDHHVRETLKIVSRAYIMSEGKVILKGTAKQLVNNKKAKEIYLGEDFQL